MALKRIMKGNAQNNNSVNHSNKGVVNTPQFPGWQKNHSREDVQDFIKNQVRRKGYKFSGGATSTENSLQISGTARFLYGIAFKNVFDCVATLTVNNEVVFENIDVSFLLFGATEQDYFAVNRPLSGQDTVKLTLTGGVAYANEPMILIYK
jgi:hypothetical protein